MRERVNITFPCLSLSLSRFSSLSRVYLLCVRCSRRWLFTKEKRTLSVDIRLLIERV